ncbi:hypothetical protein [Mangrovibacterium marinum]|uniref:hypothetical protein n=1 Tax=Mangrovibacterium marinum TaxID=1639118 RepID=UPI002A18B196|nr:hypothetical protein [Mangrovibacterium marinum]
MKVIMCLFCIIFLVACNGKKTMTRDADGINETIPKDTITELLSIAGVPDSVLTTKQLETKKKINVLLEERLKVIDNHFVLQAEPHDFEEAGLSKYYHQILKKSFEELNHLVDSLGIQDLEEKYKNGSLEDGFTLYSNENEVK